MMNSIIRNFLLSSFLVFSFCSNLQQGNLFSNAETTFANKWAINGTPKSTVIDPISGTGLPTYWLTFDVHESIMPDNIAGIIRESKCEENGREVTPVDGIFNISSAVAVPGKGSLTFDFDINLLRENSNIFSSYISKNGTEAFSSLCATYVLKSDITNSTINWIDVDLTISYSFKANIEFTIPKVQAREKTRLKGIFEEDHGVISYLCNPANPSIPLSNVTYSQGSMISVCVTPDADAVAKGIVMKQIDWFAWERGSMSQPAIENGLPAANWLTHYNCPPGTLYCILSTILVADFFAPMRRNLRGTNNDDTEKSARELSVAGVAKGSGQATMMFARNNRQLTKDTRKLQSSDNTSYIGLSVNITETIDYEESLSQTSGGVSSRSVERLVIFTLLLICTATILI